MLSILNFNFTCSKRCKCMKDTWCNLQVQHIDKNAPELKSMLSVTVADIACTSEEIVSSMACNIR